MLLLADLLSRRFSSELEDDGLSGVLLGRPARELLGHELRLRGAQLHGQADAGAGFPGETGIA